MLPYGVTRRPTACCACMKDAYIKAFRCATIEAFCENNSITWFVVHLTRRIFYKRLLIECFSALKSSYGRLVQEKADLAVSTWTKQTSWSSTTKHTDIY